MNPNPFDPYKDLKFKIKWDGHYVAGVSKVSALRRATEVIEHSEGGDHSPTNKIPGRTRFEPIVLERGVTHDTSFEEWANKVWKFSVGQGSEGSLADFRKDVTVELYNEAGQLMLAYKVFRCWVSEYQALPELSTSPDVVAFETIKLENEGWERDLSIADPIEPPA